MKITLPSYCEPTRFSVLILKIRGVSDSEFKDSGLFSILSLKIRGFFDSEFKDSGGFRFLIIKIRGFFSNKLTKLDSFEPDFI
jgi:hypothetical protein